MYLVDQVNSLVAHISFGELATKAAKKLSVTADSVCRVYKSKEAIATDETKAVHKMEEKVERHHGWFYGNWANELFDE